MRKLAPLAVMAVVALLTVPSYGDFDWYNTASNRVYYGDGTTLVDGDQLLSTVGCFVQLIWAGEDATFSTPINSGNGIPVGSDDEVQGTTWIGAGILGGPSGRYGQAGFTADSNGNYVVRFWSAPSADYGNGLVPTSTTNRYNQTAVWIDAANNEPPDPVGDFNNLPNGGISLTLQAVPEPAMIALGLVGLGSLLFFRRRK